MEYISSLDVVKDQTIKVDKSGIKDSQSQKKIISISLLTPQLGQGIENIDDLNKSELVWSTKSIERFIKDNSYEIIFENETISPWKLILKN